MPIQVPAATTLKKVLLTPTSPSSSDGRPVLDEMYSDAPEPSSRNQGYRHTQPDQSSSPGLHVVGDDGVQDTGRARRQDFSQEKVSRRDTKLGDYHLGQTLGEGEFGKVKMGWRKAGGLQVAIKLIRREKLDNASRLAKVYREISILRGLDHPNIVRLHEMVETEKIIGIVLDYASGGELFDFILERKYLHDPLARRLFAQLVSGVGYLHKKGIIHRDLKLENLLLDRNENVIITDFGFANTFDPNDELGIDIEGKLYDKNFIKKMNLEAVQKNGFRRGDLMATSCGSPCYAAPELVVSDGIYTGRKVDVWSCGVILYAMLAGYLPFDDDPANPEGDNINLLYKYIVSTPLIFPDYVTPHARDLLRRILVPDPRLRADLFEVARHSWLTEFAHVVEFITSGTTTSNDIDHAAINSESQYGIPSLVRSASVREPAKPHRNLTPVGGLASKHGNIDPAADSQIQRTARDTKRRTVQVEYVAPHSQTARAELPVLAGGSVDTRSIGSRDMTQTRIRNNPQSTPLATLGYADDIQESSAPPPPSKDYSSTPQIQNDILSSTRPVRGPPRAVSDSTAFTNGETSQAYRPSSGVAMAGVSRLPSRGSYGPSYGQPAAATVAATNAQGHFTQPKPVTSKQYIISDPMPQAQPAIQTAALESPSSPSGPPYQSASDLRRGEQMHKRSNTLTGLGERIFGRSGSFSRRDGEHRQKPDRAYPPTSMRPVDGENAPRKSIDSRRSFGFRRKSTDFQPKEKRSSRRFSMLSIFSIGNRDQSPTQSQEFYDESRPASRRMQERSGLPSGRDTSQVPSPEMSRNNLRNNYGGQDDATINKYRRTSQVPPATQREQIQPPTHNTPNVYSTQSSIGSHQPRLQSSQQRMEPPQTTLQSAEGSVEPYREPSQSRYPPGFNDNDEQYGIRSEVLQKKNRKFGNSYDRGAGSSGPARKVMDFFRRRGRGKGE